MKIAAFSANIAQLAIILAIFFIRGLDLGALVILLLFLLMAVACLNFLALFFGNQPILEPVGGGTEENGMIKREAMRISYREDRCPVFKTGDTAFAVRDLSEGGVRISASSATPFKKWVRAEIQLVCGDRIRFKATVMRKDEGAVVFRFAETIGTAVLIEEKKALASYTG